MRTRQLLPPSLTHMEVIVQGCSQGGGGKGLEWRPHFASPSAPEDSQVLAHSLCSSHAVSSPSEVDPRGGEALK